ncbi:MAG: nicotinate-nucleotide adenylyltransferase [Bacillota bacterium]|nr:nicotinate-nucleotide adenylyltransferase [Bacillota bacterium]
MKIGIYGGSFDPIHTGHLVLADQLINEAGLDKVIFVPDYVSPNKSHDMKASANDRLELIKLAIKDHPKFEVSDYNIKQEKVCYMDENMEDFHKLYPDDDLYVITGQDSFMRIKLWHNYEQLLQSNNFLIGKRPGSNTKELFGLFKELFSMFRGLSMEFYDIPAIDVSSVTIQNKLRVGKSVKYLLPDSCIDYINQNNLYDSLIPKLKAYLKEHVKESRYKHTEGVVKTARELAIRYGADLKKVEIAAWFHDACKEEAGNFEHGPLAAEKIQTLFNVHDQEIISAISSHTLGHVGMGLIDKILYVSDCLEPSRDYPGIKELRDAMYIDLDLALYKVMVRTRKYVLSLGEKFAHETDLAIEDLKEKLKNYD